MNSVNKSFRPPRGMRDFYPEDMALRNAVFHAWKTASREYGFVQYDACVVESLDLLRRKAGEEVVEQIYTFQDKSKRELALRAEITPSLARMVAARQGALSFPLKWFAIPQCFRYERMARGRKREHYQWNLDIMGESSLCAEAEIIATAVRALSLLGLGHNDVTVLINSRALLSDLLAMHGIAREYHQATFLALDKRGKIGDEDITALLKKAGLDSGGIRQVFNIMQISSLSDTLPVLGRENTSYSELATFLEILAQYGLSDMIRFDISVVRGLGYYTGMVFEAYDSERQFRAIFGGGRYDNLLSDIGGKPMTGVGLGFGDVVITELLSAKSRLPDMPSQQDMAVGYLEQAQRPVAIQIAESFRRQGRCVDMALRSQKAKAFFSHAGKSAYNEAIFVGPDDVQKRTIRIKNLADRTEKEVGIEDIAQVRHAPESG